MRDLIIEDFKKVKLYNDDSLSWLKGFKPSPMPDFDSMTDQELIASYKSLIARSSQPR